MDMWKKSSISLLFYVFSDHIPILKVKFDDNLNLIVFLVKTDIFE